jgi:hypothetical protein
MTSTLFKLHEQGRFRQSLHDGIGKRDRVAVITVGEQGSLSKGLARSREVERDEPPVKGPPLQPKLPAFDCKHEHGGIALSE